MGEMRQLPRLCNIRFAFTVAVFVIALIFLLPWPTPTRFDDYARHFASCAPNTDHATDKGFLAYEGQHNGTGEKGNTFAAAAMEPVTRLSTVTVTETTAYSSQPTHVDTSAAAAVETITRLSTVTVTETTAYSSQPTPVDTSESLPSSTGLPIQVLAPDVDVQDSLAYCAARFGSHYLRAFSESAFELCDAQSTASLTCFSHHADEPRLADSFCFGGPVILDPNEKAAKIDCGLKYWDEVHDNRSLPPPDLFPNYHWFDTGPYMTFERTVKAKHDPELYQSIASLPTAAQKSKGFSFLLFREWNGDNLWHDLMEIMSLSNSLDVMRQTINPATGEPYFSEADYEHSRIVLADTMLMGPYADTWAMFSRLPTVYLHELDRDHEAANPTQIVIPLSGVANPLWQGDWHPIHCNQSTLLHKFKRRVLDHNSIATLPSRISSERPLRLTMIDRRQKRRLLDKETYFNVLREKYPDIQMQLIDYATLTFPEQLAIDAETDILVGVHGAGLTHGMFLPADSRIVEILPYDFPHMGFHNMARFLGHRYFNRHSAHDENVPGYTGDWQKDDVTISQEEFVGVVSEAIDSMLEGKGVEWDDW